MHTDSPNSPLVAVKRNIIIKAPQAAVFTFAADLRNDARWRQEVHSTVLDAAAPAPGVVATEDAFLSAKRPHSLTQLVYEAYEPAQLMRCQTPADSPHWMRVERRFRALDAGSTEFSYELQFEQKLVREALGFAPPLWFLRWYSGWMMGKYQKKLKGILEADSTPAASMLQPA